MLFIPFSWQKVFDFLKFKTSLHFETSLYKLVIKDLLRNETFKHEQSSSSECEKRTFTVMLCLWAFPNLSKDKVSHCNLYPIVNSSVNFSLFIAQDCNGYPSASSKQPEWPRHLLNQHPQDHIEEPFPMQAFMRSKPLNWEDQTQRHLRLHQSWGNTFPKFDPMASSHSTQQGDLPIRDGEQQLLPNPSTTGLTSLPSMILISQKITKLTTTLGSEPLVRLFKSNLTMPNLRLLEAESMTT